MRKMEKSDFTVAAGIFEEASIDAAAAQLIDLARTSSLDGWTVADQLQVYLERAYVEGANMARAQAIHYAQQGLMTVEPFDATNRD